MATDLFELDQFTLRRRFIQLFGASFQVCDPDGRVVGFCKKKALRLKEDIRVYPDESSAETGKPQGTELMTLRARQIMNFSPIYDVVAGGEKVGFARRKGLRSFLHDSWELVDADDQPVGRVQANSQFRALLRRAISFIVINIIPQTFYITGADDTRYATLRYRFNPFIYKLDVTIEPECPLDRHLVFATAVLFAVRTASGSPILGLMPRENAPR